MMPSRRVFRLTLWCAEMHSFRHGSHAFGVSGLDLEVVDGVQRQLLDLVGQPVAHDGFDHPVVDLRVDVRAVVDDVAYNRTGAEINQLIQPHYAGNGGSLLRPQRSQLKTKSHKFAFSFLFKTGRFWRRILTDPAWTFICEPTQCVKRDLETHQ